MYRLFQPVSPICQTTILCQLSIYIHFSSTLHFPSVADILCHRKRIGKDFDHCNVLNESEEELLSSVVSSVLKSYRNVHCSDYVQVCYTLGGQLCTRQQLMKLGLTLKTVGSLMTSVDVLHTNTFLKSVFLYCNLMYFPNSHEFLTSSMSCPTEVGTPFCSCIRTLFSSSKMTSNRTGAISAIAPLWKDG